MNGIITRLLEAIESKNHRQAILELDNARRHVPPLDVLNMVFDNGHNLLTMAVFHYRNQFITRLLCEPGLDVNQPNGFEQTPIQIAKMVKLSIDDFKGKFRAAGHIVNETIEIEDENEKDEYANECMVCMEDVETENESKFICSQCKHQNKLHKQCQNEWATKNDGVMKCMICR